MTFRTACLRRRGVAARDRRRAPTGLVTTWTLPDGNVIELVRDADCFPQRLSSPGFVRTWTHDAAGGSPRSSTTVTASTSTTSLRRDAAGRVLEQDVDGEVTSSATTMPDSSRRWSDSDRPLELGVRRARPPGRRADAGTRAPVRATTPPISSSSSPMPRARRRSSTTPVAGGSGHAAPSTSLRLGRVAPRGRRRRRRGASLRHRRRRVRCGGPATSTIEWDPDSATPRPTAINGQRGRHRRRRHVRHGRRRLDGARGGRSSSPTPGATGPTRDGGWHPYFGVAADGVVWLGARPYDVATRQFLAPDPLAPMPGRPGSTSPYTYAANDPINLFDPTGRQPISIEAFNDIRDRRTGPQWQNIAIGGDRRRRRRRHRRHAGHRRSRGDGARRCGHRRRSPAPRRELPGRASSRA